MTKRRRDVHTERKACCVRIDQFWSEYIEFNFQGHRNFHFGMIAHAQDSIVLPTTQRPQSTQRVKQCISPTTQRSNASCMPGTAAFERTCQAGFLALGRAVPRGKSLGDVLTLTFRGCCLALPNQWRYAGCKHLCRSLPHCGRLCGKDSLSQAAEAEPQSIKCDPAEA